MKISNVSNIAAIGAEWITGDGTRCQLVSARGSSVLTLGMLSAGETRWMSATVDKPERFGMTGPLGGWTDMARVAAAFTA